MRRSEFARIVLALEESFEAYETGKDSEQRYLTKVFTHFLVNLGVEEMRMIAKQFVHNYFQGCVD